VGEMPQHFLRTPEQQARAGLFPLARQDADYVLEWLRQTNATSIIVALQERVLVALGGPRGTSRA